MFRYKWNFSEVSLNERLEFFESNWAFFAGFGMIFVTQVGYFMDNLLHTTCALYIS